MYSSHVYRADHPGFEPVEDPPAAVQVLGQHQGQAQGQGEAGHGREGRLQGAGQSTPGPESACSYTAGRKTGAS